jgi:hypothetical protein
MHHDIRFAWTTPGEENDAKSRTRRSHTVVTLQVATLALGQHSSSTFLASVAL